jgi:transposase
MTTEVDPSYLPLKVTRAGATGKRTFDPESKSRLIEACRQPGVSISAMALKAGINANQLHKWIRQRERQEVDAISHPACPMLSAFVPVTISEVVAPVRVSAQAETVMQPETPIPAAPESTPTRLKAHLPNRVTVELECDGRDGGLITTVIQALGNLRCSASTQD